MNKKQLPLFSFGNKDLPRCQNNKCAAYINANSNWQNEIWECNFCCNQNMIDPDLVYLKDKINTGAYEFIANAR